MPSNAQRLVLGDQELCDDETITNSPVRDEDVIIITRKPK